MEIRELNFGDKKAFSDFVVEWKKDENPFHHLFMIEKAKELQFDDYLSFAEDLTKQVSAKSPTSFRWRDKQH
ncbi:hypothetical protein [Lactococcus protaetiae]|uniref:Uncharacterized protein n=1 Tax=Lactococcus protaetiae TaxID=2592653 RepID=A0A514ZAY3_9LACT|nr:hypothetical protein [Lactococcus protaetiae]QDK71707.1 hypothetical protein FLP15_11670 [Lactococcus protaetiae]